MMPNKGVIVPLFALTQFFLTSQVIAQNVATLNLGFFTDSTCNTRSSITPNATLGLSVCAATLGALSIYVPTFPCAGNNVKLLGFSDTGCKSTEGSYFPSENCYEWFEGSFGSILLTCGATTNGLPGNIVSYTTISVGPLAADATSAPQAGDPTTVASTPTETSSTDGGTNTGTDSTGTSSTSNNPSTNSNTSSSSSSSSGWDQLPIGAKVGIIVGAIVAVAIIAFLIWWIIYKEKKHRFDRMVALQNPPNMSAYGSGYNQGTSVYQPSTYLPPSAPHSAQPLNPQHSPPPPANPQQQHNPLLQQSHPGYEPSRYPVTEVDWNQENNRPPYMGSALAHSDIASWAAGTHTVTANTTH